MHDVMLATIFVAMVVGPAFAGFRDRNTFSE
jgi:hypothetical protein